METAAETLTAARAAPARDIAVIDYLRGIAALGVVIFHARITLWVGWREIRAQPENFSSFERAMAWLSAPTPFFGAFVLLFFVVSGFCVHLPHAGSRKTLSLRSYFLRRFLRVYPPYLAAVFLSVATLTSWSGEPVWSSVLMGQNYTAGRQLSTNPALWSLPVEVELYLAYPLIWLLARRSGWKIALTVTALVSLTAAAAVALGCRWLDGNFALYWIIWCGGAWLAECWAGEKLPRPPGWLGIAALAALGAGILLVVRQKSGGAANLAWGVFFFWIVWHLLARNTGSAQLPPAWDRALRWLGRISYSCYLVHFPLLVLLGGIWLGLVGGKPRTFLAPLAASAAVLPVAWLLYRWIEGPSHRLAKHLARADCR